MPVRVVGEALGAGLPGLGPVQVALVVGQIAAGHPDVPADHPEVDEGLSDVPGGGVPAQLGRLEQGGLGHVQRVGRARPRGHPATHMPQPEGPTPLAAVGARRGERGAHDLPLPPQGLEHRHRVGPAQHRHEVKPVGARARVGHLEAGRLLPLELVVAHQGQEGHHQPVVPLLVVRAVVPPVVLGLDGEGAYLARRARVEAPPERRRGRGVRLVGRHLDQKGAPANVEGRPALGHLGHRDGGVVPLELPHVGAEVRVVDLARGELLRGVRGPVLARLEAHAVEGDGPFALLGRRRAVLPGHVDRVHVGQEAEGELELQSRGVVRDGPRLERLREAAQLVEAVEHEGEVAPERRARVDESLQDLHLFDRRPLHIEPVVAAHLGVVFDLVGAGAGAAQPKLVRVARGPERVL
mmetsp:Transcript_67264/g.152138  ORF Transcript_67264/g.152138 Transcript_67264/m.152138 type:complete len:410 (-) Transcript_67264:1307-2536(-)